MGSAYMQCADYIRNAAGPKFGIDEGKNLSLLGPMVWRSLGLHGAQILLMPYKTWVSHLHMQIQMYGYILMKYMESNKSRISIFSD